MSAENMETHSPGPTAGARPGLTTILATGHWPDIVVSGVVGFILYAGLLWFALSFEQGSRLDVLLLAGIFGTTIGWTVGIFASPASPDERKERAAYTNLVYAFVAGYVLSKVDPVITRGIETGIQTTVAVFGFTSFLIALALTYVVRRHWS